MQQANDAILLAIYILYGTWCKRLLRIEFNGPKDTLHDLFGGGEGQQQNRDRTI